VTAEREQALREYGFNLGIAFQLVDDLLDFTGDTERVGKPIGSDLREGKVTLPLIHLQRQETDGARRRSSATSFHSAVSRRAVAGPAARAQGARLHSTSRTGAAVEFAERAKSRCTLPTQLEREALLALPDYVCHATAREF